MWYCRLTDTGVVLPGGPGIIPVDEKPAWTDAVRIFKHPLVVYKDIYDNDEVRRQTRLEYRTLWSLITAFWTCSQNATPRCSAWSCCAFIHSSAIGTSAIWARV